MPQPERLSASNNVVFSSLTVTGGPIAGEPSASNYTGKAKLDADNNFCGLYGSHGYAFGPSGGSFSATARYTNAGTYYGKSIDVIVTASNPTYVDSYNNWKTSSDSENIRSYVGTDWYVFFPDNFANMFWSGGVSTCQWKFQFCYSNDSTHTPINIDNAYMTCWNLVKDGGGQEFASPITSAGWKGHAFVSDVTSITTGNYLGYDCYHATTADGGSKEAVTLDYSGKQTGVVIGDTVGWIGFSFDFAPLQTIYNVHYDGNGATSGQTSDQAMVLDRTYNLNTNGFSRIGYKFAYWKDGNGSTFTNRQQVKNLCTRNGDTKNLYAQWTPNKYIIRYNGNNATTGSMSDQNMTYDVASNLTTNTFKRTGYEWKGWAKSSTSAASYGQNASVKNLTSVDNGIVNLYASWEANKYIITFDKNSPAATGSMGQQQMQYDVTSNLRSNQFSRTGYTFAGWNTEPDGTGKSYSNQQEVMNLVDSNNGTITLYAQWIANGYTIAFDKNSTEANGSMSSMSMTYDTAKNLTANGFARPGYHFTSWNAKPDGTGTKYTDKQEVKNLTSTSDVTITLYAQWEENDPANITYITNDEQHAPLTLKNEKVRPKTGEASGSTAQVKTGYTFVEWDDANGNKLSTDKTFKPSRGTDGLWHTATYYAKTRPNKYKVHFDKGETNVSGIMNDQEMTYDVDANLTKNAFSREGYHWTGWSKAFSTKKDYDDTEMVKNLTDEDGATITLYARWETNNYTINYDKNATNVTGTMNQQKMRYGVSGKLISNKYSRAGYTFKNWNTTPDGTGTTYANQQEVNNLVSTNGGEITLYAQWSPNNYTIEFNANDTNNNHATGTMNDQVINYDATTPLAKNTYSRTGYTFKNWNTTANGTGKTYADMQEVRNLTDANGGTVTLYAQWSPNNYNIHYDKNNQSATGSMGDTKATYDKPTKLTKNAYMLTGYVFAGWNTKQDGTGTKYTDEQEITNLANDNGSIITLYAQWVAGSYHVIYNDNDDDNPDRPAKGLMPDQDMQYDQSVPLNANQYSREGYDFTGWNTNRDGNGTAFADKQEVKNLTTETNGYVTLYAQWKTKKYNVKFIIDGKTLNEQQIEWGNPATSPEVPARDGYTFAGWDKGYKNIKNDTVITGKYAPINYKVHYDKNNNAAEGTMNDQALIYDTRTVLAENAYTRTGYTWSGWNTKPDGTGTSYKDKQEVINLTSENGGTVTLYAQWSANDYVIRYHSNSGTGTMNDTRATYDTDIALERNTFTRTGYVWASWNTKPDGTGSSYRDAQTVRNLSSASGDVVDLYAVWDANQYIVRYDKNAVSASGSMSEQSMRYDEATNLTANGFSRAGYSFRGWTIAPGDNRVIAYEDKQVVKNLTAERGGVVTLYAVWDENAPVRIAYNVSDPDHGCVSSSEETIKPATGSAAGSTVSVSEGHHFAGWVDAAGENVGDAATFVPSRDDRDGLWHAGVFTALVVPNTYTVTFDKNNNSANGTMSDQAFTFNSPSALEKCGFERPGYEFAGWCLSPDGSGEAFTDGQVVSNLSSVDCGTVRLFAQWLPVGYVVRFDTNDFGLRAPVSGSMSDQAFTFDESQALERCAFSSEAYEFAGWCLSPDGSGEMFADGQVVGNLSSVDGDVVTLFARWRLRDFNVRFVDGFGAVLSEQRVSCGDSAVEPARPSRDGFVFAGWDTSFDRVTSDLTVTARWDAVANDLIETSDTDATRVLIPITLVVLLTSSIVTTTIIRRKQQKQK